jgi:hypothetical protein
MRFSSVAAATKYGALFFIVLATFVMFQVCAFTSLPLRLSTGCRSRLLFVPHEIRRCSRLRSSSETQDSQKVPGLPVGGDFAGLSSTFDAASGRLIPIPERLVPKALLDWDMSPSALEILVSEDIADSVWNRQTLTILPEAGCGSENLMTMKTVEQAGGSTGGSIWSSKDDADASETDCWSLCYPYAVGNQQRLRVETCFGLALGEDEADQYRSRLVVDLLVPVPVVQRDDEKTSLQLELVNPVRLCLERQISTHSSGGTVADGGLDGKRVFRWLGSILSSKKMQAFAEDDTSGTVWRPTTDSSSSARDDMLHLPGNLTLSFSGMQLEMGQVYPESGLRQVVRQTFRDGGDGTIATNSITSWLEKGQYDGKG